jgi:hypothetical protein
MTSIALEHKPRWGVDTEKHPAIERFLAAQSSTYHQSLQLIANCTELLHRIPRKPVSDLSTQPAWGNPYFSNLDAASLVAFLLNSNPLQYVEVGSGNSTKFARYAIEHGQLKTRLTSIDPQPRAQVDAICDSVKRTTLQDCDLSVFEALQPGDIMFFDGSHLLGMRSDVSVFFLEVLPLLRPGVLVHVHDIFLPYDYPPVFHSRNYDEQYMLAMFLLYAKPKVLLPNYFVSNDPELSAIAKAIFASDASGPEIPFRYGHQLPGVSFWFETINESQCDR